jgi:O-antigen ligase
VVWILMVLTFSVPGREAPRSVAGLDVIALAKLGSRALAVAVLGWILVREWGSARRPAVVYAVAPLAAFVGWALLSTLWSPLPAVSLGQSISLLLLVMLAAAVGLVLCGPRDTSTILRQLSAGLLVMSAVVGAVDLTLPDVSGLDKRGLVEGSLGLVHPTTAGSTASLGLITLLGARILWGWRWSRLLLPFGLAAHGLVLIRAANRTGLLLDAALVLFMLAVYTRRSFACALALGLCVGGAAYVAVDPDLKAWNWLAGEAEAYMDRGGESKDDISSLSGRVEMWENMGRSWEQSPWIGHGYFVTSRTGALDVWNQTINHTAHNMLLQVLVTTGLIGVLLFTGGLAVAGLAVARNLRGGKAARFGRLIGVVALWYAGWGMLSEAVAGPLQPESLVFFTYLGIGLGHVRGRREVVESRQEGRTIEEQATAVPQPATGP